MKKLLLMVLSPLLLISCGKEYIIENDKVYLKGWNEGSGSYKIFIKGADAKTFQTIKTDDNTTIGRDRNHVYKDYTIIRHLDPNTIKYLGNYYYADKEAVYFFGFYNNLNDCKISGANPKTIEVLDTYPWARDDKNIIYGHTILTIIDPSSLVPLTENWAKTVNEVLYKGIILQNADTKTFQVIDEDNGKDKNRSYHNVFRIVYHIQ